MKLTTAVLGLAILTAGCIRPQPGALPASYGPGEVKAALSGGPRPGSPGEFFPSSPGSRWEYTIEVQQSPPVWYRLTSWPVGGDRAVRYESRGFYRAAVPGNDRPKQYTLDLRVKAKAPSQGPLRYPLGVELEITRDDLGVFDGRQQVFWAITDGRGGSGYSVIQVETFSPRAMPGAPTGHFGGWGQEDGDAQRQLFFAEEPMTSIRSGSEPRARLLFVGLADPPEPGSPDRLHFRRTVQAAQERDRRDPVAFESEFVEDSWFERGKGLVRLEQKVKGDVTMTWRLVAYTPGP
jgi:hypothetical protein